MDIINQNQDEVQVRLTVDEVVAISNGLNEALESLEEWEFHVRMGVTRSEAEGLLEAFRKSQHDSGWLRLVSSSGTKRLWPRLAW